MHEARFDPAASHTPTQAQLAIRTPKPLDQRTVGRTSHTLTHGCAQLCFAALLHAAPCVPPSVRHRTSSKIFPMHTAKTHVLYLAKYSTDTLTRPHFMDFLARQRNSDIFISPRYLLPIEISRFMKKVQANSDAKCSHIRRACFGASISRSHQMAFGVEYFEMYCIEKTYKHNRERKWTVCRFSTH